MTVSKFGNGHGRAGLRMTLLACAMITLSASSPVFAHHSFAAEFDVTREVRATGQVSAFDWRNPHAWIHLGTQEVCERPAPPPNSGDTDKGWKCRTIEGAKAEVWGFELASTNGLMRLGWSRNSVKVGDKITIEGWRARDGSLNGNARVMTTPDGKRILAGPNQR